MNNHYYGGKSADGHFHQIINLIPPHDTYFEPFGGKLGIFRHKKPAYRTFIIERDERLEEYYKKLGVTRCHDITYFNNRIHKTGPGAFYVIEDALELLTDSFLIDRPGCFIYCDPPYPMDSRKDNRPNYRHELTDDEHRQLLYLLRGFSNSNVAISTYPNELYSYELDERNDWEYAEISAQTRHGRVTEQLWMNYPTPTELHDYRYLGADFREREDIIRKQKRWASNFADLPILEQRAMLEILTSRLATSAESGQGKKRKKFKDVSLIQVLTQ